MLLPLLMAVDFMNFNYTDLPCSKNVPPPALFSKGTYSYYDKNMGTGFDLHVASVKQGSLHPGTQQAVVVIACDFPIGGTSAAYLYDIRGDTAALFGDVGYADWGGDWGAGPTAIHIRFANSFLYVDSCDNSDCDRKIVKTFAWRGGKIKQVYVQTHKATNP
jgi:hypothetical protein